MLKQIPDKGIRKVSCGECLQIGYLAEAPGIGLKVRASGVGVMSQGCFCEGWPGLYGIRSLSVASERLYEFEDSRLRRDD